MAASPARRVDWKGFLLLFAIYVVVALLWGTPWVLPLKLFVVLLHEVSHAIAAVLTGGRIVELHVDASQAGHCVTTGGAPFVVVSAGYLGSVVFGAVLLLVATRTRLAPYVAAVLGAVLVLLAFRFMPGWSWGKAFAAFSGTILAVLSLLPRVVPEMALRIVGVTSCLYAFLDIKHDVLDRDHPQSDASQLEQITGVPAFFWGLLWIGVSIVAIVLAAKWSVTGAAAAPETQSAKPAPAKKAKKPKRRA